VAHRVSHARSAIAVAPQIFPFTFGDEPVNSGEAISATCSILKGDFPMDITWAFNGEPISAENTDQFSITKSKRLSVLSIDAVAARYAGEYSCTASNKAGASSRTAMLAVNGNTRAYIAHCITPVSLFFVGQRQGVPSFHHPLQSSSLARSSSFQRSSRASSSGVDEDRVCLSSGVVRHQKLYLVVRTRIVRDRIE